MSETAIQNCYILNKETGKIELHFSKSAYMSLPQETKTKIKRFFLFSRGASAWVSKSVNNHMMARSIAKECGLEDGGEVGERISFAEQQERKIEKAEQRAERYEIKSQKALQRMRELQKEFREHSKDWAFVTQPILAGHAGSQRFARFRDRLLRRYEKGFEEYEKSQHYANRSKIASTTAAKSELQDRAYLGRRIEENQTTIRRIGQKYQEYAAKDAEKYSDYLDHLEEQAEIAYEKLAYYQGYMDQLPEGFSKENVNKGDVLIIRRDKCLVERVNDKTVSVVLVDGPCKGWKFKYPYAEIKERIHASEEQTKAPKAKTLPKWDTRKIHIDLSCYSKSERVPGCVITVDYCDEKGIRYKLTTKDGSEHFSPYHQSYNKLTSAGNLIKFLKNLEGVIN